MRAPRYYPLGLLIALIPVYFYALSVLSVQNKALPRGSGESVVLPAPILRITSLDFDGLASDFLYLKVMVFYGGTFVGKKQRKIEDREYVWMYRTLDITTDLDPYFLDPYFVANGILAWEARKVKEANKLLEKGIRYREWDYWLPFYAGFNYYYFFDDSTKAADLIMKASKKTGADPFFGYLAARIAYKGNRTENAVIFLEEMLRTTRDNALRREYEVRLVALRAILFLEKAVERYKQTFANEPEKLEMLVERGIIDRLPRDPYGGRFYLDEGGAIKTTSDLRQVN